MQRLGVADRRDAEEPHLALLAQRFKRGHHLVEHLPGAERLAPARGGDGIVQVEDVDPLHAEALQACVERLRHRLADAAEIRGRQPHLGADDRVGGLELLQDAAEVLFGFAVSVLHRGVEIVDAGLERAGDGALLVGRIAAHHEAADRAAAEAEDREPHPAAAEGAFVHATPFTP